MRRTRGFTLIELMISLALFGLIASGAMMLVISGVRMQTHSSRVDVAQSAARAGLDFMTRDLLSASAGMSATSIMIGGLATNTIKVTNNTATSQYAAGSDILEMYMADSNFDYSTVFATVLPASTTISVDKTAQFGVGQYAILTDLTNAVQIKITGVTAPAGAIPVGTLNVSGLGTGSFPGTVTSYPALGAYVFALRHVAYSVQQCFAGTGYNAAYAVDTTYANQFCLMMDLYDGVGGASNPQPLAEGVEDLQVALGFDNNLDGNITTAEWIGDTVGDVMPTLLTNLKAVRVTVIAISTLNENASTGASMKRPTAEDHVATGALDGFFRRVIRSEVTVRNLNI